MAHLQPSRPMYFGCDGHIQSKMLELQPSNHVHEKSGAICKIHAKYSARAARSLAMQIRKSLAESHPRVTSMQISEDESHLSTSQSHPGVTSVKNSEASHIRWSHKHTGHTCIRRSVGGNKELYGFSGPCTKFTYSCSARQNPLLDFRA